MRILHYCLGFPPYRSGGMTRFAYDLMRTQALMGHEVLTLWPGRMQSGLSVVKKRVFADVEDLLSTNQADSVFAEKAKETTTKKHASRKVRLTSLELKGALPVPLDEGILNPEAFMTPAKPGFYEAMLAGEDPDVIHLHTLMGLHEEFFEAAHERGLKIIMTTHDYFGLCFKTNLYYKGANCALCMDCSDCTSCNQSGLSLSKITLMQSGLYRSLKNTAIVRAMRSRHRGAYFDQVEEGIENLPSIAVKEKEPAYAALRRYYYSELAQVDAFHYNSELTKQTYEEGLALVDVKPSGRVLPLTHAGMALLAKDKKAIGQEASVPGNTLTADERPGDTSPLVLAYLGQPKAEKGYYMLTEAVELAKEEGAKLRLKTYPQGYAYGELPTILSTSDLVVVPSLWRETFGFVVAEALAAGVPVLCSDMVGAKDLLGEVINVQGQVQVCAHGAVFTAGQINALEEYLVDLTREQAKTWRDRIAADAALADGASVSYSMGLSWKELVGKIEEMYNEV